MNTRIALKKASDKLFNAIISARTAGKDTGEYSVTTQAEKRLDAVIGWVKSRLGITGQIKLDELPEDDQLALEEQGLLRQFDLSLVDE